jgi:hypothetical protein
MQDRGGLPHPALPSAPASSACLATSSWPPARQAQSPLAAWLVVWRSDGRPSSPRTNRPTRPLCRRRQVASGAS